MLETIGILTLIALVFYIAMQYQNQSDIKKSDRQQLINDSRKCQSLIYNYNRSIESNKPLMRYEQLQEELDKIINNPVEIKEIENLRKLQQQSKIKDAIRLKEYRKIGYQYEKDIFEIFDTNEILTYSKIKFLLQDKYFEKPSTEIDLIFSIWEQNYLVQKCYGELDTWEIGFILTSDIHKLIPTDLTWEEWLKLNNKTKEPAPNSYSYVKHRKVIHNF
jgi:hypothetical protein